MYIDWWSMPGPSTFVERIARDLRSGYSVIVWLPEWTPEAFRESLRRVANQYPIEKDWEELGQTFGDDIQPIIWLWKLYNGADTYPPVITPAWLLNTEQRVLPKGCILELPACSPNNLSDWINFLREYQQAAQQDRPIDRTGFLLVAEGFCSSLVSLQSDLLLKVHLYREQHNQLDMMLFLSQKLARVDHPAKSLERQLVVQTAATLFPFDPNYAVILACQLLINRIDNKAIEQQIMSWQTDRGWQHIFEENSSQLGASWSSGWTATVDGQSHQHLCIPNKSPLKERVRQAFIYAQMQVLLPWIEQTRWSLIHQPEIQNFIKPKLPRHFDYSNGTKQKWVESIYQLEFTHILELAKDEPPYSLRPGKPLRERIWLLRECRNDLSHIEPLTPEKLYQLIDMSS